MTSRTQPSPSRAQRSLLALLVVFGLTTAACGAPASMAASEGRADEIQAFDPAVYAGVWSLDADLTYEANETAITEQQGLSDEQLEAAREMLRTLFSQMDNRMELLPDGLLTASQTVYGERVQVRGIWAASGEGIELILRQEGVPEERSEATLVEGLLRIVTEASESERLTLVFRRDS